MQVTIDRSRLSISYDRPAVIFRHFGARELSAQQATECRFPRSCHPLQRCHVASKGGGLDVRVY